MTRTKRDAATQAAGADEAAARQVLWARPGYLVRRLNQIHYALFCEECGALTPVQYGVLTALSLTPWMDQKTLGMELGLDRTTTADVIRRLQERGLVERRVNPGDRRSRQAVITPQGRRVMARLRDRVARVQQRMVEPLSPAEREVFLALLARLVEANNECGRAAMKLL